MSCKNAKRLWLRRSDTGAHSLPMRSDEDIEQDHKEEEASLEDGEGELAGLLSASSGNSGAGLVSGVVASGVAKLGLPSNMQSSSGVG